VLRTVLPQAHHGYEHGWRAAVELVADLAEAKKLHTSSVWCPQGEVCGAHRGGSEDRAAPCVSVQARARGVRRRSACLWGRRPGVVLRCLCLCLSLSVSLSLGSLSLSRLSLILSSLSFKLSLILSSLSQLSLSSLFRSLPPFSRSLVATAQALHRI